jgi:hypothetical protein
MQQVLAAAQQRMVPHQGREQAAPHSPLNTQHKHELLTAPAAPSAGTTCGMRLDMHCLKCPTRRSPEGAPHRPQAPAGCYPQQLQVCTPAAAG